jgi:hypothetical protein
MTRRYSPAIFARGATVAALLATALSSEPAGRLHPIIYVQAVKYKPSVSAAQADDILRSARETFARIPQVRSIRIGRVARTNVPGYEYALIMEFDNLDDLRTYGASEIHRDWVKEHAANLIDQHLMLTVDTTELER